MEDNNTFSTLQTKEANNSMQIFLDTSISRVIRDENKFTGCGKKHLL